MTNVPTLIQQLDERFDRNIHAYKSPEYNETELRVEFVNPFWKALGWDMTNEAGYAMTYRDVIHEDAIKVGTATKAPDCCFRIGGMRKFFLETKRPALNLKDDPSPAFQLRRYGWSAKLSMSILTDFEEMIVYDCRIRPKKTDKASQARIMYITYNEYLDKWDEIESLFSREAVLKGSFDKYAETTKGKRGTAEVDKEFLKEIEGWREILARNIALRNPSLNMRELNFAVQMTVDRIIFLRMCEDRGIEKYGQLQALCGAPRIYPRLIEIYRKADDRYNSGLFHFEPEKDRDSLPDELTPKLKLDDKVLKEIFQHLYYPDSPYEFRILPPEILGNVYEQFLGKVIRLTKGHQAKVEEKPEVRKAGGVYYTPKYIVDYIVKNTVGKLLGGEIEQKIAKNAKGEATRRLTPAQASRLRILDPACGSGSFLIGAYQHLLDWHLKYYLDQMDKTGKVPTIQPEPGKKRKKSDAPVMFQGRGGDYLLTTVEKKRILLNNIYGVDIDTQAVEVTKLSLLLKVLENENQDTLQSQLSLWRERALPDLSSNIKCGNSLIGPDFYEGKQMTLFDEEEQYRINAFDWEAEFREVFGKVDAASSRVSKRQDAAFTLGGFDAVIGNPPYVFTRGEGFTDSEKQYFDAKFEYQNYQLNTFALFTEKAFVLIRNAGRFGFIIPNNWISITTMKAFRDFLVSSTGELEVINNLYKVFPGANIDTSIVTFAKKNPAKVRLFEQLEPNKLTEVALVDAKSLLQEPIIQFRRYKDREATALLKKIENNTAQLKEIALVKAGLKAYETGKGDPPQTDEMKKARVYHNTNRCDKTYRIYLQGRDVVRYLIDWSGSYLKYGCNLAAPRDMSLFDGERILVRQIPSRPPYSLNAAIVSGEELNDINSMIVKATSAYSLKYVLGIINSLLLTYWFNLTFDKFQRAIFPQFKVKELAEFPICTIDFSNKADVEKHDRMVALVESMLDLHKKVQAAKTPDEKTRIERQIAATDKQIDSLVYDLYGLTEEEIKIVEGEAG